MDKASHKVLCGEQVSNPNVIYNSIMVSLGGGYKLQYFLQDSSIINITESTVPGST